MLSVVRRPPKKSAGTAIIARGFSFAAIAAVGVGVVLLPYWISIIRHPIEQMPIPHASRSNLLMNWTYGMNYFIVPYGALLLALPFVVIKGASNTAFADSAARLLGDISDRAGRHDPGAEVDLRPRL